MRELLPTKELVIKDKEWEGYSLWKYIKQLYPHYTKVLVIKELRLKRILVNNTASYFQYKLLVGDTISISVLPEREKPKSKKTIYLKKEELEKFKKDQLLFENEHLVIAFKYAGQTVQPDSSSNTLSLSEILQRYSSNSSDSSYQAKFVHRLDRPVSGLLIGAKTAKSHNLLSEAFKKRELTKLYQAIVAGECNFKTKRLTHWIDDRGIRVKIREEISPESKYSEAKVTKLKSLYNCSLVELQLITGRKNQLRAQLSYIGFPILGDRKYYSEEVKKNLKKNNPLQSKFNPSRIALIAYKLSFPAYLVKELELPWTSFALPEEKNVILKALKKT